MNDLLIGKTVIAVNMDFELACICIVNEADYERAAKIIRVASKEWEEGDTVGDWLADKILYTLENAGIDVLIPEFEEI